MKANHNYIYTTLTLGQVLETTSALNTSLARKLIKLKQARASCSDYDKYNKILFNLDLINSPLCRAYMQALHCPGVANYKEVYLGVPTVLPEVFK